jgi:hypothetical protein
MKSMLVLLAFAAAIAFAGTLAADTLQEQLNGTWSGNWTPAGGVLDAMTIQLSYADGKVSGKFVTPAAVNFTKATFNPKTRLVSVEAVDAGTGKYYKLNGKVEGTEINGTVTVDNQAGPARLIKWTYVPRINGY